MKLLVKLLLIMGIAASSAWTMGCQRNDYDTDRTGSPESRSAPATADDDADVNIDAPNPPAPPSPPDVDVEDD